MTAATKFTTCEAILEDCNFANAELAPTCIQNWCDGEPYGFGSCTEVFTGTPANCCSESDIASCMAAFQASQGYGDTCLTIENILVGCEKTNSNFNDETYAQQAQCVCYDSNGNFAPDVWDDAAATCVSTGQTAHPTIWSQLVAHNSAAVGLCTKDAGSSGSSATGTGGSGPTATGTGGSGLTATGTGGGGSPTGSSSAPSSSASRGAAAPRGGQRMSHTDMKWIAIGLGLLLPGFFMVAI